MVGYGHVEEETAGGLYLVVRQPLLDARGQAAGLDVDGQGAREGHPFEQAPQGIGPDFPRVMGDHHIIRRIADVEFDAET